ncbi:hypothetical protein GGX14DRAFT_567593 [Mycena pura]|uniref:RNase H type-1 domain-containing protein n=1 Tax=Mycena pura TaxID=153505 RepID=A0AAD6VBU2_9AGAR|nr:hypothetical protein GGX14DRAFT_567593 [Mycena pura]
MAVLPACLSPRPPHPPKRWLPPFPSARPSASVSGTFSFPSASPSSAPRATSTGMGCATPTAPNASASASATDGSVRTAAAPHLSSHWRSRPVDDKFVSKLMAQSLKEDGIISTEIRACVQDIVGLGAPVESVGQIIHAVAKGLGIEIKDNISARSVGRIIFEGSVAAHLQIVDTVKNADHLTGGGDGTSPECKVTREECPACMNPNRCHLKARQLFNSLKPKWNPLEPQPEDYEDAPAAPFMLGEDEKLFNPKKKSSRMKKMSWSTQMAQRRITEGQTHAQAQGHTIAQSNNVAEILAVKQTVQSCAKDIPLRLKSDSKLVVEGLTKNLQRWEDEGFQNTENGHLIKVRAARLHARTAPTTLEGVKGHS